MRHFHETSLARLRIIPQTAAAWSKSFHTILKPILILYIKHGTFKQSILNPRSVNSTFQLTQENTSVLE
jgi:hypothetical protein